MEGRYTLADFAREHGMDPSDFDDDDDVYFEDSGVGLYDTGCGQQPDADITYEDDMDSSPSPRDRRGYHLPPQLNGSIRPGFHPSHASSQQDNFVEDNRSNFYPQQLPIIARAQPQSHQPYVRPRFPFTNQHDRPPYRPQFAPNIIAGSSHISETSNIRNSGTKSTHTGNSGQRVPNTQEVHGIRLRPVSELPDMYRALYTFGVFNAVQSECFETLMHTDDNMVVSAPTGSGKTTLFELAIIRMLTQSPGGYSKCIYVAPTKALCSEKFRDWSAKFDGLGIKCCELTGDTVQFGRSAWGEARDACVIVTTSEKWDSLTRNWEDHEKILSQIQLFLVDEVHILKESRGSTLEVIISRMKARGSQVRFILVSATVPNICDVAAWIGNAPSRGPAIVKEFGEEFRPCKLSRFVVSVPRKKGQNDYVFARSLDFELYGVLEQHSAGKPILVFCSTRKGVMTTAEQLLKEFEEASSARKPLPWTRPRSINKTFHDKRLDKLAGCGVGVHHAGMTIDDRRATEDLYLGKILRVVVATSTLAVGVNLPAHVVVIKGVKMFQNNGWQEYSDLDVMQMMGRAGRPQFDKEGIAVIMCEPELEAKYKALAQGRTILESCLHHNLAEHINSEIGLGTITSISSAKEWLHNSFLFQRIQKNPRHYAIGKNVDQSWQDRIDEMVTDSVKLLKETQLVEGEQDKIRNDESLYSTGFGDIMSKYYIRQSTMKNILQLEDKATLRELLESLSASEEFADIKLRSGEKQIYNKMRDQDEIRFRVKRVEKASDKVCLIIQAVLGGLNLNDSEYKNGDNQPSLEALSVFRHILRICRAMVEVAILKKSGAQLKHGVELLRCLNAKAWEDRPTVLRQIEQIGEKSIKLLNRRPPFGNEVLATVNQLPIYALKVSEESVRSGNGSKPVEVELSIECRVLNDEATAKQHKKSKFKGQDMTIVLTVNSELDFIDFRRIPTRALQGSKSFTLKTSLTKPSQSIIVQITSENYAGLAVSQTYKPNVPQRAFPTLDTRPMTSVEMDLQGLEDDPNFWNVTVSDDEQPQRTEKVREEEVDYSESHILDLTIPKEQRIPPPKPAQTVSRPSPESQHQSVKPVSGDPSRKLAAPIRLPNGRYKCNHSCKDKTSCRHMCCRDGLAKPPAMSKRRVEEICGEEPSRSTKPSPKSVNNKAKTTPGAIKTKGKEKAKASDKADSRLMHLENLHDTTNVRGRLKLPDGLRIKVEESDFGSRSQLHAKARRPPNFDIHFTDLKEGDAQLEDHILDASDSGEELPEIQDVLLSHNFRKRKDPSSDTHYSDSVIDAGIRDMSPSTLPSGSLAAKAPSASAPVPRFHGGKPSWESSPYEKARPSKRTKLSESPPISVASSPIQEASNDSKIPRSPLFLPNPTESSEDHPVETEICEQDEDFVVDQSIFHIWNSTPDLGSKTTSPRMTSPPSTSLYGSSLDRSLAAGNYIAHEQSGSKDTVTAVTEEEDEDPWADDLEAFEKWFNGGGVIITDRLD